MNITNDREIMIFKDEKEKYSTTISKKNQNGEYENAYFPIQFNKDVELENRTLIKIKNAWLSFYNWEYEDKKGTKFFIKCSDFEVVAEAQKQPTKEETNPFEEFAKEQEQFTNKDMELPF